MKISVFGLGYVGCVSAACIAKDGHKVIGVDVNRLKVDIINQGKSPIIEKDCDEIIKSAVNDGRLEATTDTDRAVAESDISLVCVGTPSQNNGSLDLSYIENVCSRIGEALAKKGQFHVVVIRSTVLPGTIEGTVIPILEEASGLKAGVDFGVCSAPEFLREGAAVSDFYDPPVILIGEQDNRSGDMVQLLFGSVEAPLHRSPIKVAEMIKYACNSFHALKVAFANEIGNICKPLGVDSHEVMDVFCMDTKLNLSPYYLKPGFAFGGSCLPKDVRALLHRAKHLDLTMPVLESVLRSNELQIRKGIDMVLATGEKKVGVLGMSFKAETDDLRESPMVELIETLIGKGLEVKIYDRDVSLARIFGSNKEYIEKQIPHISSLMCSTLQDVVDGCKVLVVGNKTQEFKDIVRMNGTDHIIVDLVRLFNDVSEGEYHGICW